MACISVCLPCLVVFSLMALVECRAIDLHGCVLPTRPTDKDKVEFQKCVAATNGILSGSGDGGRWGRSLRHQVVRQVLKDCPLEAGPDDFVRCVLKARNLTDAVPDTEGDRSSTSCS